MQLLCFAFFHSFNSLSISSDPIGSTERLLVGEVNEYDKENGLVEVTYDVLKQHLKTTLGNQTPTDLEKLVNEEIQVEVFDLDFKGDMKEEEPKTIVEEAFINQKEGEVLEHLTTIVGEDEKKLLEQIKVIEKGDPDEKLMNMEEIADTIMTEKKLDDVALEKRGSLADPIEKIMGFDDICKKEIFKGEDFLISFLVKEHIGITTIINQDVVTTIAAKLEAHSSSIGKYVNALSLTKGLIDALYSQYVPLRVAKLVGLFETELGIQAKCKVSAFAIDTLGGDEVKKFKADINTKMTAYLDEWQSQNIEIDSYRPLAETFYKEISIITDDAMSKEVSDRIAKYPKSINTLQTKNAEYKKRLDEVNACICPVLKNIIYCLAGLKSTDSVFNSKFGGLADNASMQAKDFKAYATELLDSFSDSITKFKPQTCGDETQTIQEMIFYSRTNTFITAKGLENLKISVSSVGEVWSSFFAIFENIQSEEYRNVIDYDFYILRPNPYSTNLVETMINYRSRTVLFHTEFFNLMSNFPTFFIDKGMGGDKMAISDLRTYFMNWEKGSSISVYAKTKEFGFQSMAIMWVSIYKLYVAVRIKDETLKPESKMGEIFASICKILQNRASFDSEDSPLFSILFEKSSLDALYPHLISYIAKIAETFGEKACIVETNQNIVIPIIPAVDPNPNVFIEIHTIIINVFKVIKIDQIKKTFKEKLIGLKWDAVANCPEGKFKDFNYEKAKTTTKTVVKKSLKVSDEKDFGGLKVLEERKIYRFTNGCTTKYLEEFDKVMLNEGFDAFSKNKIERMYKEMIRIFYEVVDGLTYENRGLIFHVMIKWLLKERTDIKKITEHKKMFTFHMFEVVEKRVLRMINYYDTAGFYGYLTRVEEESDKQNLEKMYKHKNSKWAEFQTLMKMKYIDRDLYRADLFYLVDQAIINSIPKKGDKDEKIFNTNTDNALRMLTMLFGRANIKELKEPATNWQSYVGFYESVMVCRWNVYEGVPPTGKQTTVLDGKFCVKKGIKCEVAENTFKDCNIDFALKMISYLHTLPILLYGISAYDTHNYFHKYFTKRVVDKSGWDKKSLARLYQHYQNIRLSNESQVSDIVHYTLDRTLECMTEEALFAKTKTETYDANRFCVFSLRTYAEIYWNLKYQFAVNFSDQVFDLSRPIGLPLFGTTILILNIFTYPALRDEFIDTCSRIEEVEPAVDICRVYEVVNLFIEMTNVEEGTIGSEEVFTRLNSINEAWVSKSQATLSTFIMLEAMWVMENLGDQYEYQEGKVVNMLNYRYHYSAVEVAKLTENNVKFESFLIKKEDKDAIEMLGQYLYYNFARKKVYGTESTLRELLVSFGPADTIFNEFTEYNEHVSSFIYRTMLTYSPDLAFSKSVSVKVSEHKWFFSIVTMDFSNEFIEELINSYNTQCIDKKDTASLQRQCFFELIVAHQQEESYIVNVNEFDNLIGDQSFGVFQEGTSTSEDVLTNIEGDTSSEVTKETILTGKIIKKAITTEKKITTIETTFDYNEYYFYDESSEDKEIITTNTEGESTIAYEQETVLGRDDGEIDELMTEKQQENLETEEDLDAVDETNNEINHTLPNLNKEDQTEIKEELNNGAETLTTEKQIFLNAEEKEKEDIDNLEDINATLKKSGATIVDPNTIVGEFTVLRALSGI